MSVPITVTAVIHPEMEVNHANTHTNSQVKKLQSGSEVTSNVQLNNLKDSAEYLKAIVVFFVFFKNILHFPSKRIPQTKKR